jgi:hypothetical protein
MQVVVMIDGWVFEVLDLQVLPSVGEVVTTENVDFFVSNLSFQYIPSLEIEVPVVGLLPVSLRTGRI